MQTKILKYVAKQKNNKMIKKKDYTIFIHIIAWLLLFLLPLFFFTRTKAIDTTFYVRYLITPISLCLIFYLNYFILINRYLLVGKLKKFILLNAITIVLISGFSYLWEDYFSLQKNTKRIENIEQTNNQIKDNVDTSKQDSSRYVQEGNVSLEKNNYVKKHKKRHNLHHHSKTKFVWWHIIWNIIYLICSVGMAIAIRTTYDWYINKEKQAEKKQAEIEAELRNLKSQLNPHFLFNTLNNIYALIAISQEKSQEAVMELSKLLRYVLYESDKEFVPLSKELEFTTNYIELMKLRLQSNVELEVTISNNSNDINIAPLLFITLVENTFKHGIAANKQLKSFIHIDIHKTEDSTIVCHIENSYHPKNSSSDKSGSGIGVENLKRRLELIYPNNHTYTCNVEENVYKTTLIINPIIQNET